MSWTKAMQHELRAIRAETELLHHQAKAFEVCGNLIVAKRLFCVVERLSTAATKIDKIVGEQVTDSYQRAVETSGNLAKSIMAVAEHARKKKEADAF